MESNLKKILRALSLELRHILEGYYDNNGKWHPGDLKRRLNEMGVWRDRPAKPLGELPHLTAEDITARKIIDAYITFREEAGVSRHDAVAEFVRESAYTWANRLFVLRCMEARGIIDEVILQKDTYGGRSLVHNRFARKNPEACSGEDDGLFAVLFEEYAHRAKELPSLFDPQSPAVALRPSVAALKKCVALLSGREAIRGQEPATDAIFESPDALGWAYQYWNTEEKDRVFEMVRTKKGAKIEGADIIPVTQLYTEPYMVKFLVQNSLGAIRMGMYPESKLCDKWEYYVKDADRAPVEKKPVSEIAFLDPACGSGHFHLEAFDLFYAMYEEEGVLKSPEEICASILNNNLFGIDIDGRAVQIAAAALWMKAREKAQDLDASDVIGLRDHLVATNIRLPKGKDHLEIFLKKHPEDEPLRPALETVLQGLENVHELGSLVQIEEPVERELNTLKEKYDASKGKPNQKALFTEMEKPRQREFPIGVESYEVWKQRTLERIKEHFEKEAQTTNLIQTFFSKEAIFGLAIFNLLSRRYDVVTANPPYMGSRNFGKIVFKYLLSNYPKTKNDLFSSFIERCGILTKKKGFYAMVTQQSWFFLALFSPLRKLILDHNHIDFIVHLGSHAFEEITGAKSNVVLFVIRNEISDKISLGIRLISINNPSQKANTLLRACSVSNIYRHWFKQSNFEVLPNYPFAYWMPLKIIELFLINNTLGDYFENYNFTKTGGKYRFIRYFWETPESGRWIWLTKGGRYCKWIGNEEYKIDWSLGARKHFIEDPIGRITEQRWWYLPGVTYTTNASKGFAARFHSGNGVYDYNGPCLSGKNISNKILLSLFNSRIFNYMVRFICGPLAIVIGDIKRIPAPISKLEDTTVINFIETLVNSCLTLKEYLISYIITEKKSNPHIFVNQTIRELILYNLLHQTLILTVESLLEKIVFSLYELSNEDISNIVFFTGIPVGWLPIIKGYNSIIELQGEINGLSHKLTEFFKTHTQYKEIDCNLIDLKKKLCTLYEAGFKSKDDNEEINESPEADDAEEELIAGAHIPIPPETFLEELSQKLEIHPISVYWLLKEGIEKEGWRCIPEEQRTTFDHFTVMILRLLGHRWPKQIEAGEPVPAWADEDGIIPITEGCGEKTLLELVRERIANEFSGGNVASIEREFEEIAGMSLEKWLLGPFFKRHISQFKKRPIAWQIESGDGRLAIGNRRKSKGALTAGIQSKGPAFSCLLYYHKLGPTTLLDIRRLYVDKLSGRYETELRTLEGILELTAEQSARKIRLEGWIDELKSFDQKLNEVARSGFCTENLRATLRQYAINDAMLSLVACWLRKLSQTIQEETLSSWQESARATDLHNDFPQWIFSAIAHLDHHCAAVCPKMPNEKGFKNDPTSADLAPIISAHSKEMIKGALSRACDVWWKQFDEAVVFPLKRQINQTKEHLESFTEKTDKNNTDTSNLLEKDLYKSPEKLKMALKKLKSDLVQKISDAKTIRSQIESCECQEAETWKDWLSTQPLFDKFASLDGKRPPPKTTQEFIEQEVAYCPDINDGVRVNIAPLQKAGLLASEVLPNKDLDKAIADRAEWRADERRWCREGRLPMPGWWK